MFETEREKARVSLEAFLEEVHNWQLTLGREQKKLKSLRSHLHSKIHINELDIIVTQIEAELIRYRKLSDPKKIGACDIIYEYNVISRKFMDLMEAIGSFADKIDGIQCDNTLQLDSIEIENAKPMSDVCHRYHDETFTYAISKQPKFHKEGLSKTRNPQKKSLDKKGSFSKQNKSLALIVAKQKRKESINASSMLGNREKQRKRGGQNEDFDAWEIRYQLKEIKSMMKQIKNEIKFHSHDDLEAELGKVQHNNKKMSLELKGLREDSQYIVSRMQKMKEELGAERQIQAQMIQEFESPERRQRPWKGKSPSETHNCSGNQEVSDWVRIRI